jgi:autotransporter translocation and assembly factor TamB
MSTTRTSEPSDPFDPAAAPPRPRRGWRWTRRIVLGLLAFVVVAVGVVLGVLHTDYGRNIVRSQIEGKLATTFVGGASIGKLEGSPFGELVARDVVINGPDGRPAIRIKRLQLHIALLGLASHEARISGLVADDVDIELRRDDNGELQIKHLLRPAPESAWSVDLPEITVNRAHVAFDTGTEVMNLDQIQIRGAAHVPKGKPIDANVALTASWRERGAPIKLAATFRVDREGVTSIPMLAANVGAVEVTGAGLRIFQAPDRAQPPVLDGSLVVKAPRAAVAQLAPQIDLPDDVELRLIASPGAGGKATTHLELDAKIGPQIVRGLIDADLAARRVAGVISAGDLDLAKLTRGKLVAHGGGFAVIDLAQGAPGQLPVGHAMIHASGQYQDFPETGVMIALSSTGDRVTASIGAANPGLTAALGGELTKVGDRITLERGTVVASTRDPEAASGGKAPIHGVLNVDLAASGVLAPTPELAVTGKVHGKQVRFQDLTIASLDFAVDARRLPGHPIGKAVLSADGVSRGDMYLRELRVNAANREDGKIQVSMRSRPKQDPWLFEADALVTPGAVVTVDLQRHRVRAGNNADWTGNTGRVTISKQRIELRDLRSASRDGVLTLAGIYYRTGTRTGAHAGDLVAKVDANAMTLDNLSSAYRGTIDAHVDVERTDGRFAGTVKVKAAGLALHPSALGIDAEATIDARADQLVVSATAGASGLGTVKLALDIDAPKDIANIAVWKHMHRDTIRTAELTLQGIDLATAAKLAGLPGEYAGKLAGDLRFSASGTGGTISLRDLRAPALRGTGGISADLQLSETARGELNPTLTARVDGIGNILAEARIHVPDHLFDPDAWREKGRGALHGASIRADNIAFDPGMLDRFGLVTNARGTVSFVGEITESMRSAKLGVAIRQLRGSPVSQPVQVDFTTAIDDQSTTTSLIATTRAVKRTGKVETPVGPVAKLLEVSGSVPFTIDELIANPRGVLAAPLKLVATVPNISATQLLAVFGRTEVTGGTIDGKIDVAGTVGEPTLIAKLVGSNLQVPPGPGGKPVKTVKTIAFDARWDGTTGKVVIDGVQENGMLKIVATGSPAQLAAATVTVKARQFDLVPLLAFAPGPAGGAAGRLDADLTVKGLDPRTAKLAGEVHLSNARIPIAPTIGTLRRAKLDVVIGEHDIRLKVDGRLGGGKVVGDGAIALDGAAVTGGDIKLTLRKVSPIGVVEPVVDADVTVKLHHEPDRWVADVGVRNAVVTVPSGRGEQLKPAGAPPDMVFMNGERITRRPMKKEVPIRPMIVANVTLYPTHLKSDELRGIVKGKLSLTADGEAVGIVGTIDAERGDLDLFGTRYQVERASVRFDGTIDPVIDVRISHDFPEVTTVTEVRGRLSKPELTMSSNPGTYSQGQLLGFLLGGEPTGEPNSGRDVATSAGTSLVANKIGGYVKGALPIDLDVLRYEAATSTTSAAITVGTWLRENLFIAYRRRLEARPDENSGEGQLEYWLSRRVMVEATAGDRGYNGVDLLWRRRY